MSSPYQAKEATRFARNTNNINRLHVNLISIKLTQQAVKVRPIFLSRACDVAEPFAKKKQQQQQDASRYWA